EEAAPGMLGPARRGNVQMDVAGPEPEPVHGREVANRIALVRMRHQLWLGGRPRSEVEQQRIAGPRCGARLEPGGVRRRTGEVDEAWCRSAGGELRQG